MISLIGHVSAGLGDTLKHLLLMILCLGLTVLHRGNRDEGFGLDVGSVALRHFFGLWIEESLILRCIVVDLERFGRSIL